MTKETPFTPEIAEEICHLISTLPIGTGRICERYPHLPCRALIYKWILRYPEFKAMYLAAKENQAHLLFDDMLDIARPDKDQENPDNLIRINRDKLAIDTYKITAERLAPCSYAPKRDHKIDGVADLMSKVIDKL